MKYIDYPTKTKKNSFSLWIQGPSALLVKKENGAFQGPATICDHRKPEKVLLPTFYRRISVIVSLPNFKERPIRERIAILKNLFHREAKRMTKDINVDEEIFTALLENDEPGNVGSLSNKVRLLCASQLRKTLPNQPVVIGDATQPMIAIPLDKEVLEEDTLSSDIFATFEALFTKEKHWPT